MKRVLIVSALAALLLAVCGPALAGHGGIKSRASYRQSQTQSWHGDHYDMAWGSPVAVLVPPTAESQAHLGWGVGATRVTSIRHQFQRGYAGPAVVEGAGFLPTPHWPSSTDQFGNYYIRGPW